MTFSLLERSPPCGWHLLLNYGARVQKIQDTEGGDKLSTKLREGASRMSSTGDGLDVCV